MTDVSTHWILTLVCEDRPGIVHAISGAVVAAEGNITESQQFSSDDTGTFFMRLQVESATTREAFEAALAPITEKYSMDWRLDVVGRPLRTLVLASKAGHCLNDLLYRQRAGQLSVEIPLVLANHPDLQDLAAFYGVPFEAHAVQGAEQKADFMRNNPAFKDIPAVKNNRFVVLPYVVATPGPRNIEGIKTLAAAFHLT